MFNIKKKNNRNYQKNIKKDYDKLLRLYQSELAHQEMVFKAGGGVQKLIDIIDIQNEDIKLMKIKIFSLMRENILMENKLLELVTTYKFKNRFITIEINKSLFDEKLYKSKIYKFLLFIYNKYYNNIILKDLHIKNLINIKKINVKNSIYILKVIIVISNLIYFISNLQNYKIFNNL